MSFHRRRGRCSDLHLFRRSGDECVAFAGCDRRLASVCRRRDDLARKCQPDYLRRGNRREGREFRGPRDSVCERRIDPNARALGNERSRWPRDPGAGMGGPRAVAEVDHRQPRSRRPGRYPGRTLLAADQPVRHSSAGLRPEEFLAGRGTRLVVGRRGAESLPRAQDPKQPGRHPPLDKERGAFVQPDHDVRIPARRALGGEGVLRPRGGLDGFETGPGFRVRKSLLPTGPGRSDYDELHGGVVDRRGVRARVGKGMGSLDRGADAGPAVLGWRVRGSIGRAPTAPGSGA